MNGTLFKAAIFQRQIRQSDVAQKLGCSPSKISLALRGYRAFTKTDAKKLAKILHVNTNDLFPEYEKSDGYPKIAL